ncbi:uncharacterized protein EDB91DRAFT_1165294 [Suillus paluster]|uniref:uncharacterized protein n=1 Tax=Suillus paluster TaxID=48578 RepID=UPI001B86ED17|nr:uncharacterized protein EDB91DRAFT_1165294 [Suillus paluster]KAG1726990.1 hypothetical protein EDB91DRAFT_1165294 [Suillus paluster]
MSINLQLSRRLERKIGLEYNPWLVKRAFTCPLQVGLNVNFDISTCTPGALTEYATKIEGLLPMVPWINPARHRLCGVAARVGGVTCRQARSVCKGLSFSWSLTAQLSISLATHSAFAKDWRREVSVTKVRCTITRLHCKKFYPHLRTFSIESGSLRKRIAHKLKVSRNDMQQRHNNAELRKPLSIPNVWCARGVSLSRRPVLLALWRHA